MLGGHSRSLAKALGLGTAKRGAEVTGALARFGFDEFLIQSGLDRFLGRRRRAKGAGGLGPDTPLPVRVRLLLEELGPTFIKGGQILSTRRDLLPTDWIDELRKLQADVPPVPWGGDDGVERVLRAELGARLDTEFESIEHESMAAASIAQVHRATLRTGERVVIKVLRPGTRERMRADLDLMRLFGRLTHSYFENLGFDVGEVVREFSRQLQRETDLTQEGASTDRMRRDFEDAEGVRFPMVYTELTTRSVLVMERIEGTLLANLDIASLTAEQRATIVRRGADAVFRQCLVIGFFHADPHPGNIFVLEGERLCFIDCGMTGLIDPRTTDELAQIVHGAIDGDLPRVLRTALIIANADSSMSDNRAFRADVWHFVDRFHGGSIESIRMGHLLSEFFDILRKYHLRCPADIVYLIKALTTIEGVAESIAPEFDLVAHVRPYVERLIKQRYSFASLKERVQETAVAYADLIEELPADAANLVRTIRRNELSLNLDHKGLDSVTDEIENASVNISWALVVAALMVGSAVLVLADSVDRQSSALTPLATAGFIVAVAMGLWRLLRGRIRHFRS